MEAALGLEAPAEVGGPEKVEDARRDAAGDVEAAARTEGQRQVAGDPAEQGAEVRQRRPAMGIATRQGPLGDLGRCQALGPAAGALWASPDWARVADSAMV